MQDFIRARGDRESEAVQSSTRYVPLPSCKVFAEYCTAQVDEHFGGVRMIDDNVTDLAFEGGGGEPGGAIRVTLSSGRSIVAAQVVHAARWSTPVVPSWMVEAKLSRLSRGGRSDDTTLLTLADVDVRSADVEGRSVVVVGGGMGACTLATAALRRGARRVTLLCRGIIRRREQECDVGYFGNKGLSKFRAVREPTKRLEMLREARGGSINSQMWMQVQDAVNNNKKNTGTSDGEAEEEQEEKHLTAPTFNIIERREVERVEWCDEGGPGKWRVVLVLPSSSSTGVGGETSEEINGCSAKTDDEKPCSSSSSSSSPDVLTADFVWAACGEIIDASRDPVLQNLLRESGRVVGGYPVLVEDEEGGSGGGGGVSAAAASGLGSLRWPGMPLYFVGAYSSLSVGPGASLPAGHRLAARAVSSAMHVHARECRKSRGINPYAKRLTAAQLAVEKEEELVEGGIPRVLRLVPKSERHRALMDARELKAGTDDTDDVLPRVELSRYEVIDEDFLINVRLTLPEAVPRERVRIAFTKQSVEVWAAGDKAAYRFFVAKLYKPIIVERCTFKVSQKNKRITVVLHKFDNLSWRFLKG